MKKEINKPQIAIYQTLGNEQKIYVRIKDENVWLTQKLIAQLFDVDVRTVNEHLVNIYLERELDKNQTIRNFRIVQKEASKEVARDIKHYNLGAILAIGYRVRSDRGRSRTPNSGRLVKRFWKLRKKEEIDIIKKGAKYGRRTNL